MIETNVCGSCFKTWNRKKMPGRKPRFCPQCAGANSGRAIDTKIRVVCPRCQGPVKVLNSWRTGYDLNMIVKCTASQRCRHTYTVTMTIILNEMDGDGEVNYCNTELGYQRHVRANEEPCEDCITAHARTAYDRKRVNA